MSRNELIIAINNLYDRNIDLEVRNEFLENQLKDKSKTKTIDKDRSKETNEILNKIIEYGQNKLFDEVIRSGYNANIKVWKDEETKELKTTSLDQWLENKIYKYNIPDYMSIEDVKNILHIKILELYDEERANVIKEFEKSSRSDENE